MSQIEFRNVTKEYDPGFKALDDVSLTIDDGEFIFLVGPSGAGKSTLIKMLIREEFPSEGEVLFNEVPIAELPRDKLPDLRRRIGVVFQDFKLLNSKNVFENVAVALEVVDSPDEVIKNVVPNVLSMVGLVDSFRVGKSKDFPLPEHWHTSLMY